MSTSRRTPGKPTDPDTETGSGRPKHTVAERVQATRMMGGIGGVLFAGFLLTIVYSIYENSKTVAVDGVVLSRSVAQKAGRIGTHEQTSSERYRHEFEYTDLQGNTHVGTSVGTGRDVAYSTGDVVSIGYYPDDRGKVRERSWFGLWQVQFLLAGLGLVLMTYSVWGVRHIKGGG